MYVDVHLKIILSCDFVTRAVCLVMASVDGKTAQGADMSNNTAEGKLLPVQETLISKTSHDRRSKSKKVVAENLAIMSLDMLMRGSSLSEDCEQHTGGNHQT